MWYRFEGYQILVPGFQSLLGPRSSVVNGLPTLRLEIQSGGYAQMAEQRQAALNKGGIWEGDNASFTANVRFQEQQLTALVRLSEGPVVKREEGQWSLEIGVLDQARLLGMRAFFAQPIDAKQFLHDWWYAQSLREAGLLASRCALVNFVVNGDDWGLYVLREAFTVEWLASQDRGGGPIVRLDERLLWERRAQLGREQGMVGEPTFSDPIAGTLELPAFAQVVEDRSSLTEDGQGDRDETEEALKLLRAFQERQRTASQVFDAELLGRYIAHTHLWGARQGLMWYNARYYYNPLTSRLEPIGHDARPLPSAYAPLDLAQYDDLEVMVAYAHEVARITHPDYLVNLRAAHADSINFTEDALSSATGLEHALWDTLAERQAFLAAALHPRQSVLAYEESRDVDDGLVILVANLLRYPVALWQFSLGDRTLDIEPDWVIGSRERVYEDTLDSIVLKSAHGTVPQYLSLRIPADAIQSLVSPSTLLGDWRLEIVTQLVGTEALPSVEVESHYPSSLSLPIAPSVLEALERYPFLEQGKRPETLALRAGTWQVVGNLVLPEGVGLEATQPITLAFERGAGLFATGPLWLDGPERGGIHLVPQQESWGGLIVYRADSEATSWLRNVEIRGAQGIRLRNGSTSAGVTFYESPVVLERCRLVDSSARDALHAVRTHVKVAYTEFGNVSGNALDGKQVRGQIVGCVFHDVLGNGIDVDHSQVDVQDTSLVRIYDKAIVAGQGSLVSVESVHVADAGLAIAGSDLSHLQVHDLRLEQIWLAGLAAYRQEWAYGQASIQATHLISEGNVPILSLAQPGNRISVDGVEVAPSAFDVQALHWRTKSLAGAQVLIHRFGDDIRLLGYALDTSGVESGKPAHLVLYWQALAEVDLEYTVFVHALDESGQLVAQWDSMPRENKYPTTHWLPGRVVTDPHVLALPTGLASGTYRLAVGMYFWQTGERLPIRRLDETREPDGMLFLEPSIEVS
jgi:hypothetical protein